MKAFIVATIALISVGFCAASGSPSSKYLPPNYAASAPSNQYLAPHAAASSGAGAHYHGVDGAAHYAAPVHHAPSGAARYSGGHHAGAQIPILRNDFTLDANSGNYDFGFETGNGISRDESGKFVGGWPDGSQSVKGSYSYTGDDGHVYTVNYTADENGFHAEGDHLPKNNQPSAGAHGSPYGHAQSGAYGGHHQAAASAHAPPAQYLPPKHQQQQQHGGYSYGVHRRH